MEAAYADCDGDGQVGALDICGIALNWSQSRPSGQYRDQGEEAASHLDLDDLEGEVLQAIYAALQSCPDGAGKDYIRNQLAPLINLSDESTLPVTAELHHNFPNPFNPTTTIQYYLPERASVTLTVLNILGQTVVVLEEGMSGQGYHLVTWNGFDRFGRPVTSGVYLYRLETGSFSETRKMLLLK